MLNTTARSSRALLMARAIFLAKDIPPSSCWITSTTSATFAAWILRTSSASKTLIFAPSVSNPILNTVRFLSVLVD